MANSTIILILSIFLSLVISHYAFMPWYTIRNTFPARTTFGDVQHLPFDAASVCKTFTAMARAAWRDTSAAVLKALDILGVKRRDVRVVEMEEEKEEFSFTTLFLLN
ncbi:hypothetical protein VNO80_13971 [Phaseolus coccineus]|uniref:Uncharacterized protein n=1 Tax=Phaseolus coccineus TaxID=3886 RepID=A0AAN9N1Y2_PHACN